MQSDQDSPDERPATSTSRSLLVRLYANDPAAWDRLVTLYGPLIWSWCRSINLPRQEIGDVLQEVFKAVAIHYPNFHKDRPGDTFRGWLRTITRSKVLDHYRRLQREPAGAGGTDALRRWSQMPQAELDDDDSDTAPGDPADPSEHWLFRRALELIRGEFEQRSWQAFWRVVVDGRAPQDVAAELNMSPVAVRIAKCRILQRLRQELGDVEHDDHRGETPAR